MEHHRNTDDAGRSDYSSIEIRLKTTWAVTRVERFSKQDTLTRFRKAGVSAPEKFSNLFDQLHESYVQELKNQQCIDFDDMIIRAIDAIQNGTFLPTWSYILVDEFQDISSARMKLVTAILEKGGGPSLTVVADDWQSIYRFNGGQLELTTRFDEKIGAYTSTKLQKTFRYNNSIANTAGQFIMENPEQYKKKHRYTYESAEIADLLI